MLVCTSSDVGSYPEPQTDVGVYSFQCRCILDLLGLDDLVEDGFGTSSIDVPSMFQLWRRYAILLTHW